MKRQNMTDKTYGAIANDRLSRELTLFSSTA